MDDYLLGCAVLGAEPEPWYPAEATNASVIPFAENLQGEIVGKGGGGHHGGGHHGGGGRGRGFGWGGGGPWWGGGGYYPYYDVDLVEVVPTMRCVRFDAKTGECLEYAPVTELVGIIDLGEETRKMNALKPVTVEISQTLLRYGQQVINQAIADAKQPWYKRNLSGESARNAVLWKLKWHADNLPKYTKPYDTYPGGDDLKKWVLAAYIEANAVEEGNATLTAAWNGMWSEIATKLASMPRAALSLALQGASNLTQAVTGLPLWAWGIIGLGAAGLLGFIAWKLANSRAGAAAVSGFIGRRGG